MIPELTEPRVQTTVRYGVRTRAGAFFSGEYRTPEEARAVAAEMAEDFPYITKVTRTVTWERVP